MSSPLYTPTGKPVQGKFGKSQDMRTEFTSIETAIDKLNDILIPVYFDDLNTAASRFSAPIPWAGSITEVLVAPSVNNAGAATGITVEIGGAAVTMPTLEVGASDTAGTVQQSTPTADNTFSADTAIEVITDGNGTPTMPGYVMLRIQRTS